MIIENGKKYLITTDNYFYGPDGHQYKAVYGPAEVVKAVDGLGFNPVRSTNWYIKVGTENENILLAGCQCHYAVRTDKRPELTYQESVNETAIGKIKVSSVLYLDGHPNSYILKDVTERAIPNIEEKDTRTLRPDSGTSGKP